MAGGDGATYKGGIKAYWKRRGYGRLDPASSAHRRPRLPTAELGDGRGAAGGAGRWRRGWRVRRHGLGRRILRALSPRRLLARLRDAYVRGMLRLASSAAVAGGGSALYGGPAGGADPFGRPRPLREYDEKALVEIYRSILARGGGGGGGVVPVAGDAAAVVAVARLPTVAGA
uniref:Uncharacterized protein n=1 Tax=Oryza nivara TaxID=4536 RepID=A0A0E0HDA3_ORYNI